MDFHRVDWAPGTPAEDSPELADMLLGAEAKAVGGALRCLRCGAVLEVTAPRPMVMGDEGDGFDGYAVEYAASVRWVLDAAGEGVICPKHHDRPAVPLDERWSDGAWGPPGEGDERFEDDGAGDDGDFEAEEGLDTGGGGAGEEGDGDADEAGEWPAPR